MAKFCIFCGQPPTDKNKEHVIPRWLIELTGDPKRKVRLGITKGLDGHLGFREFAFDQFTFPACSNCNSKFADLEGIVKPLVLRILAGEPISGIEISTLLDWFDKVRVGLWLAFHQLDKGNSGVNPQFHIEKRIGQFDRLLVVERMEASRQGLGFCGADSIAFGSMPSAFGLMVNDFSFINVSSLFLFARRLGFPFARSMHKVPDSQAILCQYQDGMQRVMRPIMRHPIRGNGIRIFQPMYRQGLQAEKSDLYDTPYVRAHSYDHLAGVGAVFIEDLHGGVRLIQPYEPVKLNPKPSATAKAHRLTVLIETIEWQNWLLDKAPSLEYLPPEEKFKRRLQYSKARMFNEFLIEHHKNLLRRL